MASSQPQMTTHTIVIPSEIGGDRFIAEVVLDTWTRTKRARRVGGVLWLDDHHIHDVVDAVRVLGRRGGDSDRFGWTGRVFPLRELIKLGAAIGPDKATLGSVSYDIEYGVLLEADETVPVEERVTMQPPRPATGGLVTSRPITNGSSLSASSPIPNYGMSPGRYNATGESFQEAERRPPSGMHRRVD